MRGFLHVAVIIAVIALMIAADPAGAQSTTERTGCLSFHEVHPAITAQEALRSQVPPGFRIYPAAATVEGDKLLLRETPVVSGADVADAQPGFDPRTSGPILTFRLNALGTRKLGSFSRDNIGRPFAIVVDGRVLSAPRIMEPILGGRGQVSGDFTVAEMQRIVGKLRSGTCP